MMIFLRYFLQLAMALLCLILPEPSQAQEKCKASAPATSQDLTPAGIKNYVAKNKLLHPHELICCLPDSMRKNYVIVTESFSAQGGAEEFIDKDGKINPKNVAPRVILFSEGKPTDPVDFSISFNGLPEQRNHMNLEMMTFEKKPSDRNHHGFFDLDFSPKAKTSDHTESEIRSATQPLHLSEKNPAKCVACHGRVFEPEQHHLVRPRWNSNPFWPNTFGSDPTGSVPRHLTSFEQDNKTAFRNLASKNPGYSCLIDLEGRLSRPFGMTDANTEYSLRVAAGNRYRISSLIRDSTDYEKYKFAIVASLMGCHSDKSRIDSYIPEEARKNHNDRDHLIPDFREAVITPKIITKVAKEASKFHIDRSSVGAKAQRLYKSDDPVSIFKVDSYMRQGFWTLESSESIAALRYLIEGRGIYMGDYSIDVMEGSYRFNNATRFGRSEAVYIAERIILDDPDFQNKEFSNEITSFIRKTKSADAPGVNRNPNETVTVVSQSEVGPTEACNQLKAESLKAFEKKDPISSVADPAIKATGSK